MIRRDLPPSRSPENSSATQKQEYDKRTRLKNTKSGCESLQCPSRGHFGPIDLIPRSKLAGPAAGSCRDIIPGAYPEGGPRVRPRGAACENFSFSGPALRPGKDPAASCAKFQRRHAGRPKNMRSQPIILASLILWVASLQQVHAQRAGRRGMPSEVQTEIWAQSHLIEAEKYILTENFPKALEELKKGQELVPGSAAFPYRIALIYLRMGDREKAIKNASLAVRIDSTANPVYFLLKANIYKASDQYLEAIETYEDLIRALAGQGDPYYMEIAVLHQLSMQWKQALKYYRMAEKTQGLTEDILSQKQHAFLKLGDLDGLIADWDRFLEENPDDSDAFMELLSLLLSHDREDLALERLKLFEARFPGNSYGSLFRLQLAMKTGDAGKSLELLDTLVEDPSLPLFVKVQHLSALPSLVSPDQSDTLLELLGKLRKNHPGEDIAESFSADVLYELGKEEDALKHYLVSARLNPTNFQVWQNIVTLEGTLEEYDSLAVHTKQAMLFFPNQPVFYFYAGIAHYSTKNYQQAVTVLQDGSKLATQGELLTLFYTQLGDAHHELKQHPESDDAYEQALKHEADNPRALNNYSYFLSLRQEKLGKALSMSSKLVEKHPKNASYLDTHGWVLYMLRRYQDAAVYLKKACELEQSGVILEHYGDALYKNGSVENALQQWIKAKETGEASQDIDRKIENKSL